MLCLYPTENILAGWGTKFGVIHKITQTDWPSRQNVMMRDEEVSLVSRLRYWLKFLGLEGTEQISTKPLLCGKFWTLVTTTRTSTVSDTPSTADIESLQARITLQRDAADEGSNSVLPLELSPAAHAVNAVYAVNAIVGGRELFMTDDNRVGLCSATAMVGDTMFHVVGSRLPVLLRLCTSDTGTSWQSKAYNMVGICFASDLSDEVVNEAFSQAEEIRIR